MHQLLQLDEVLERRSDAIFFTPALLVIAGKMPCDPVQEFVARFNIGDNNLPFCIDLPQNTRGFFTGLGTSIIDGQQIDWDRRLYGVPRSCAVECFNFIGGIGVYDRDFYASAISYEIDIPNPTQFIRRSEFSKIPIHVFGVLINNHAIFLNISSPPAADTPYVNKLPPYVDKLPLHKMEEQLAVINLKINTDAITALNQFKNV